MNPDVEVEGTLVVMAERPSEALDAVAALERLDGYALSGSGTHAIRDVYFDNAGLELAARRLALRLRAEDGRLKLTLKQESEPQGDVRSRPEVELSWSPAALQRIVEMIRDKGVALPEVPPSDALEPDAAMNALSLQPFSARSVLRRARGVTDASGRLVAELAIDDVTFLINGQEVRHCEIECEAKGGGDAAVVQGILDALKHRFPALRPFVYSKLDIADGLERLAAQGRLAEHLERGVLKSSAYDAIRTALRQAASPR